VDRRLNQLPRHHRYSFPSESVLLLPRSTEAVQSWSLNLDGVSESPLPVKKRKPRDRREKPEKLVGCLSLDDADVGDYFTTRPNVTAVMRRGLDSADVHAGSPVNSSGVHIVIDDGKDSDDVTYGDDVIVVVGEYECTSG